MSSTIDRLTLLETFARIADRGSISAAGRDLGLSQATVSRQLKALEDRMGVELVRRTTHALALTPAGQAVLRDARALIADWAAFSERHTPSGDAVRGPLKVVAPVALGQTHLVDIALRFQRTHPDVSLVWQLEDHPIRFAEVGCDCWIKVGPVPDETLIVRPIATVERLVVAAPRLLARHRPADAEALAGPKIRGEPNAANLPFVALSPFEGEDVALFAQTGRRTLIRPAITMTSNNIVAAHRAVCLGVGAAVLPRWFVADELASGALVDVWPRWRAAELTVHIAYLPARHQPRRLSLFLEAIAAGFRDLLGMRAPG